MKQYRCITADPPWLERGGGKSKRGADRHYPLMNMNDIFTVMYDHLFGDLLNPEVKIYKAGCHLWLWSTSNFLKDALMIMECLGFTYKTSAVWVKHTGEKLQTGLGQYMRHVHEWLLLGTMGKATVPKPENRMPSVILAPRTKHSAKPIEAYKLIEKVSPEPRLELFARQPRDGWTVWGNEVNGEEDENSDQVQGRRSRFQHQAQQDA